MGSSVNDPGAGASAAGQDRSPPEMVKERETKEDGRYIIFYSFGDDEEAREDC